MQKICNTLSRTARASGTPKDMSKTQCKPSLFLTNKMPSFWARFVRECMGSELTYPISRDSFVRTDQSQIGREIL